MAAKKSSKVKDLPRKSVSTTKASNVKGGRTPDEAGSVSWSQCSSLAVQPIDHVLQEYFKMTDKKNAPVRDLPEKKIPAGKADQIKGGRRINE